MFHRNNRYLRPSLKTFVSTTIALVLVLVLVLIVGSLVRNFISRNQPTLVQEPGPHVTYDRLLLSAVDYTSYSGGRKLFSLQAEEIVHRKRKVGPLTINPIKEIEMTKVNIEINSILVNNAPDHEESEFHSIPFQQITKEVVNDRKLGLVSRAIMNGLELIVVKDGKELFSISSKKVVLKADAAVAQFRRGFLVKSGECELFARKAEWNSDSREFWIEEHYLFKNENGTESASDGRFAIDRAGRITKK
jgi:hypothetical protein